MTHAHRILLVASLGSAMAQLSAQFTNGGFEETSIIGDDTIPDDWSVNSGFGASSITDGHSGGYSLGVWHWYWYGPGIATIGDSPFDHNDGVPFTGTLEGLSGFFKRSTGILAADQVTNDSGQVTVMLTRWNPALLQRDTVAYGARALGEQADWSPFSVAVEYIMGEAPDTLVVQVLSGIDCFCGGESNGNCCYLYVDDLALETGNGMNVPLNLPEAARVVASGHGQLEVRVPHGTALPLVLCLHDATGRLIGQRFVRNDRERFHAPEGADFLTFLLTSGSSVLGRGKVLPY